MTTTFKKINAFTLSEMLVVLVISAIVVSISMAVLTLVQKQILGIAELEDQRIEINFLERCLWQDFNRGDIYYDKKNGAISMYSKSDTVRYRFQNNLLLRDTDTIGVKVEKMSCYLDGEEVFQGAIDAVEIWLGKGTYNKNIFVFGSKDAEFYMNN